MRFLRRSDQHSEAPCPRCCIPVATDARECPHCGFNLAEPDQLQDGWTAPVLHGQQQD